MYFSSFPPINKRSTSYFLKFWLCGIKLMVQRHRVSGVSFLKKLDA